MWTTVRASCIPAALVLLLPFPLRTTASELPYNPTQLLLAEDSSTAYIIRQISSGFELDSIDLTSTITASMPTVNSIQSPISVISNSGYSFSSAIDSNGTITLYAGNCSDPAGSSQVWSLPTYNLKNSKATWTPVEPNSLASGIPSSRFLSTTIAFPGNISSPISSSKVYIFGGMCPNSSSTVDTWQSSASYTNSMLRLSISNSSTSSNYSSDILSVSDGPIAQAGQSITPLTPAYSQVVDGSRQEQQNFIFIGGHTSSAWMNMSRLAIFSLPQESWSYVPVSTDSSIPSIYPRSGHSAVLSSDGKQVIVYGGWVGDVDSAATPQLLILNVGNLFGGSSGWSWTSPNVTGSAPSGSSLYGHAAIMLPGNIMMISGGYSITNIASRIKRSITQQSNSRTYLYNVSSNAWITEYNAPASAFKTSSPSSNDTSKVSTGLKIGLGVGAIGAILGILIISGAVLYYKRKQRKARELRADNLRYSQGFVSDEWGVLQYSEKSVEHHSPPEMAKYHPSHPLPNQSAAVPTKPVPARYNQARPRERPIIRSNSARTGYQYERSSRNTREFEPIAPIKEGVEDIGDENDHTIWESSATSDPFRNALGITNHEPGNSDSLPNEEKSEEHASWPLGWSEPAPIVMDAPSNSVDAEGRSSPSKSDRTMSSLSSVSAASGQGLLHTLSRGSVLLGINSLKSPFSTAPHNIGASSTDEPTTPTAVGSNVTTQSGADIISTNPRDVETLYLRPSRAKTSQVPLEPQEHQDESPKRQRVPGGFLRRISLFQSGIRSTSLTAASSQLKTQAVKTELASSSGTENHAIGTVPRRAASDASVWSSKRGAKDWGEDENDEEWEPEKAIINRAVQTMYTTVPRGTLRVVNPDDDKMEVGGFFRNAERTEDEELYNEKED